jgi:hypothetical protein
VRDGTEGGPPSATDAAAALKVAAQLGDRHLSSAACKKPCAEQPWRVGCRPSAHAAGLGELGAEHLTRFERASVLPQSARYLVFSTGGGFGNQLAVPIAFTLAALLSKRIPVLLPGFAEAGELAFDLRHYFQSSIFPFHGSPSIRNAIAQAEAHRGLSYKTLPCAACPQVQVNETALLVALSRDDAQVVRVFDWESRYTNHPETRVKALLQVAVELKLPAVQNLFAKHSNVYRTLLQLLLQPTPLLTRALSPHRMVTAPPTVAVHIRTGDKAMLVGQMQEATRLRDKTGSQGIKCGGVGSMELPQARDQLLNCVARFAGNRSIFFASDNALLGKDAARRFGSQMLPTPPGVPMHTFRAMDKMRNASTPGFQPHLKQMVDFVLLASAPSLMLTCGSFGDSAWALGASATATRYSPQLCEALMKQ